MHKIIFKHWQTGEQLEVTGSIDPQLNHPSSDRLVVTKPDGSFEDIIKTTVIEQVEFGPNSQIKKSGARRSRSRVEPTHWL